MPTLKEYHKPTEVSAALALLQRKSPPTVPLAGGTWLTPRLGKEVQAGAVVDLSALGLDGIERDPDTLRLGPMATLAEVARDDICRSLASGILARTAKRDATVNVRNAATVGGTVVVAPADSEFILALLALAAELAVRSNGITSLSLARFLSARPAGLVTQLRIHLPLRAVGGIARVTRTPADHPIVAAVAVIAEDQDAVRIALGGVAPRPLLIELEPAALRPSGRVEAAKAAVDRAIDDGESWQDFRGSAEYRREMGALMAKRALAQAVAGL